MEKKSLNSSRFISLSGLSGILVGLCGLVGAFLTYEIVYGNYSRDQAFLKDIITGYNHYTIAVHAYIGEKLFLLAAFTVFFAFIFSFIATYRRTKKEKKRIWDGLVYKQLLSLCSMLIVGIIFELKLIDTANYGLIIPTSLVFYGISLVVISKYTSGMVKNLGYAEIVLGLVSLWFVYWDIYFFAMGFGIFHILYGIVTLIKANQFNLDSIRSNNGKW
jgi:hypothetical protein